MSVHPTAEQIDAWEKAMTSNLLSKREPAEAVARQSTCPACAKPFEVQTHKVDFPAGWTGDDETYTLTCPSCGFLAAVRYKFDEVGLGRFVSRVFINGVAKDSSWTFEGNDVDL